MKEENQKNTEEKYTAVILGTGLKESILAGILSSKGIKTLQIDASSTYGSSSRTIQYGSFIEEMKKRFPKQKQFRNSFSETESLKIQIDLTPKIFLADEGLIRLIAQHNLSYCMEFSIISEQYVIKDDQVIFIPTTKTAALTSNLCGPLQLLKVHKFVNMIKNFYNATETEKKIITSKWKSVKELYNYFGISEFLRIIIGHGIALYSSEEYSEEEPGEFIMRLTTYFKSVARINGTKTSGNSPFLYPKYGISEISQGFARLSAVKGGVTRMGTEILSMERTEKEYILNITTDGVTDRISTEYIIANDQYYSTVEGSLKEKVYTLRGVYLLRCVPGAKSKQAMILSSGVHSDTFLLVIGEDEEMCPSGYSIGYLTVKYGGPPETVKTLQESEEVPENLKEIVAPAVNQLYSWKYSIMQQFLWVDEAEEGLEGIDPIILPLKPMDHSVDFRTVLKEVENISKFFNSYKTV